jgi:hypothetical protein
MTTEVAVSKTLSIRECGYDEHWLQNQIEADPSTLGLGDLEFVRREALLVEDLGPIAAPPQAGGDSGVDTEMR